MSSTQKKACPEQSRRVFVAMSGGVDSSVAVLLLKNQGYDVTGVHLICWEGCENNQDKQDAMRVAARLDIPFLVWDFRKEYKEAVFNYMILEYKAGRTPNPDVMCNKKIKFGIFLKHALEAGADYIATGHYARLEREFPISSDRVESPRQSRDNSQFPNKSKIQNSKNLNIENSLKIKNLPVRQAGYKLKIAKDPNKDQSYFLWTLTQDQLQHCLFPIGDYLKSEVRQIALEAGLPVAAKKDSQGLCFVGKIDFQDFLRGVLPTRKGVVVNLGGAILGHHDGAEFYTIGQRHGLNIGGIPEPIYIAERNISTNTLVVAKNAKDPILYRKELIAENLNWLSGEPSELPLSCLARIRYRQPLQKCLVNCQLSTANCQVVFDDLQRAVAPGQSVVFYKKDGEMLGGGVIK